MDERLKHRIIGSLVLLSGSLALAPLVLHGNGLWRPRSVDIPPAPVIARPSSLVLPVMTPVHSAAGTVPSGNTPLVAAQTSTTVAVGKSLKTEASRPAPEATGSALVTEVPRKAETVDRAVQPAPEPLAVATASPLDKDKLQARTAATEAPALPQGWTIQVASLENLAAAGHLADKLRQEGYHVYQRQVGQSFKVFVGPELQKTEA